MKKYKLWFSHFMIRMLLIVPFLVLGATDFLYSQEEEGNDEQEQSWSISSGTYYYSRYTRYGVDLSEDRSAISLGSEISHESGLSAGFDVFALTGINGGYEHSSFYGGYEYPLNTFISMSGTYTYHTYKTDSMTVLAGISNTLSFDVTFHVNGFLFFVSYNAFFGGGTANYATTGASILFKIGELTVIPSVQLCIASQTVIESLLPKNRGMGKNNKKMTPSNPTTTITGLSNLSLGVTFRYPLGFGFDTSVRPSYEYSPTDLAVTTNQFVLTIGLEHSIDF